MLPFRPFFKWIGFVVLFNILTIQLSFAQNLIYSDSTITSFNTTIASHGATLLSNCTTNQIDFILQKSFDITRRSNGETYFYGMSTLGFSSFCYYIPWNGFSACNLNVLTIDNAVQGLTCDENGDFFAAGEGITRIKGPFGAASDIFIGYLPPDLHCQGDITYRGGKFYMVAMGNKLVEVNMKHPELSQVIMQFPAWVLPVHGLTTIQVDCDSIITYAAGRGVGFNSELYTLDIDNLIISPYCSVNKSITGLANDQECILPQCDLFIDLDNDNSSLAFWGNYCADTICLPPVAVADTDVVVLSMANTLDSMLLELTGIQDGVSEYLETSLPSGNLTVLGNGSSSLLFIKNGATTVTDFEAALKSVVY